MKKGASPLLKAAWQQVGSFFVVLTTWKKMLHEQCP